MKPPAEPAHPKLPDLEGASVEELSAIRDVVVKKLAERARGATALRSIANGHDSVLHGQS